MYLRFGKNLRLLTQTSSLLPSYLSLCVITITGNKYDSVSNAKRALKIHHPRILCMDDQTASVTNLQSTLDC